MESIYVVYNETIDKTVPMLSSNKIKYSGIVTIVDQEDQT